MWKKFSVILSVLALLVAMGCAPDEEEPRETISMPYVEWDCAVASTDVAAAVLQEELGYDVERISVGASAMWEGVRTGDMDAHVAAWLPVTHEEYMEAAEGEVVDLGVLTEGAKIGLVVPDYVDVDSIEDLNQYADQFDNTITGIDPGAGVMSRTEEVIEEYELTDFELQEGSGATMAAALADAIRDDDWIAVTGWSPHWKFGRWDLKYLDDPKNVYGDAEYIGKIARQGLEEDHPEVYNFLNNFEFPQEEMAVVMDWNEEYPDDRYANAVRYIEENPEKVQEWLGN